jgi:hypothetical protein
LKVSPIYVSTTPDKLKGCLSIPPYGKKGV